MRENMTAWLGKLSTLIAFPKGLEFSYVGGTTVLGITLGRILAIWTSQILLYPLNAFLL